MSASESMARTKAPWLQQLGRSLAGAFASDDET